MIVIAGINHELVQAPRVSNAHKNNSILRQKLQAREHVALVRDRNPRVDFSPTLSFPFKSKKKSNGLNTYECLGNLECLQAAGQTLPLSSSCDCFYVQ